MNKQALRIITPLFTGTRDHFTVTPANIESWVQQRLKRNEEEVVISPIQPSESGAFVPLSTAVWSAYMATVIALEQKE